MTMLDAEYGANIVICNRHNASRETSLKNGALPEILMGQGLTRYS